MNVEDIKKFTKAVLTSGKMLRDEQSKHEIIKSKNSKFDYGIVQDKMSEEIILNTISLLSFPINLVSEESPIHNLNSDFTLFVDPLDGSINYSRGLTDYAVSVAIFRKMKPYYAVVYVPAHNELFIADINGSVTKNSVVLPVPKYDQKNTLVNFEWSGASNYVKISAKLQKNGILARVIGSSVVACMNNFKACNDGVILTENKPWDVAAGIVFAKCLRINCTDFNGNPVDLSKKSINTVIAQGKIHQKILNSLK